MDNSNTDTDTNTETCIETDPDVCTKMEGNLGKWEGYMSGWSTKYFVLENGTLSCYATKNSKTVGDPAKEHLNLSLCEIIVDPHASRQWELRITLESKTWYLKASRDSIRSQWIRALGSAKACLLDTSALSGPAVVNSTNVAQVPLPVQSKQSALHNPAKKKKHSKDSKTTVTISNVSGGTASSDDKHVAVENVELHESLNNLFLSEEENASILFHENELRHEKAKSLRPLCAQAKADILQLEKVIQKKEDLQSVLPIVETSLNNLLTRILEIRTDPSIQSEYTEAEAEATNTAENRNLSVYSFSINGQKNSKSDRSIAERSITGTFSMETFFSSCEVTFSHVHSKIVRRKGESAIPADLFLAACQNYLDFFDRFAGTVMAPLKTDIQGNINKIKMVMESNPEKYIYLQDILDNELQLRQFRGPDTATQALLWLTRALRVMCQFLRNTLTSDSKTFKNPSAAFWDAYSVILRKHHNWVVQKLFRMGIKMLSDFDTFILTLTNETTFKQAKEKYGEEGWKTKIEEQLIIQGREYSNGMKAVVNIICAVYEMYDMEI